ncbi:MAG: protein-L-isoaspartate O-methyltransferase family protein [Methyloceanibacter sp.]|uniref:protein-L-isoaspartate O-methyltransferase family protein n=1 Tax=Methyloceanibacter sp. TaxID=1965321 RepID=UPI003D9B7DC9
MADFERQRDVMVESQLRPNEVTDPGVLSAMRALPRERFVPPPLRGLAYMDDAIEVFPAIDGAPARFLLAPMVLARLVQLAMVESKESILDVGCATGYSTAVLARLGRFVTGLEPEPELASAARATLRALDIANVEIITGALAGGHETGAPYDVILLNGSVPVVPESLLSQLREGGRLATVLTRRANLSQGKAYLFVKVRGEASGVPHFDAGARPLPGFAPEPCFTF